MLLVAVFFRVGRLVGVGDLGVFVGVFPFKRAGVQGHPAVQLAELCARLIDPSCSCKEIWSLGCREDVERWVGLLVYIVGWVGFFFFGGGLVKFRLF